MLLLLMNVSLKKILKQSNILYFSSNEKLCKKTITILKLFFKKIIYSDDINKALETFNTTSINIIISEIDLYKSNGISFIKNVRELNNNIPIIVLTENKDIDTLLEAIKLNLTDYLLKPVDTNKLISSLNRSAKKIYNNGDILHKINHELIYNYLEKNLTCKNIKISLTKNESNLFELLLSNKNKIVTMENIKKHIWITKEVSDSAFKTLFSRLNNKVGKNIITNSFGVGYGIFDL